MSRNGPAPTSHIHRRDEAIRYGEVGRHRAQPRATRPWRMRPTGIRCCMRNRWLAPPRTWTNRCDGRPGSAAVPIAKARQVLALRVQGVDVAGIPRRSRLPDVNGEWRECFARNHRDVSVSTPDHAARPNRSPSAGGRTPPCPQSCWIMNSRHQQARGGIASSTQSQIAKAQRLPTSETQTRARGTTVIASSITPAVPGLGWLIAARSCVQPPRIGRGGVRKWKSVRASRALHPRG